MITIQYTAIEEALKSILQRNIKITLKNKILRRGKLIVFRQNNYFIELILQTKENNRKKIEIPIPFAIESWKDEGQIFFDYRKSTLIRGKQNMDSVLDKMSESCYNKFYNNILQIDLN